MMSLGDVAANLGLPVFPCSGAKRPITDNGLYAATTDKAQILAMFSREGAALIGMPTGRRSGYLVIDVDPRHGGDAWLNENREALPETLTHATPGGGVHLVFVNPVHVEIRNSAGKVAPGVDVRAEGGYVILPPSPGYTVADPTEPAEMPEWLIKACQKKEPQSDYAPDPNHEVDPKIADRYVQAALDGEIAELLRTPEGQRNHNLNIAAVKLAGFVPTGYLTRSTIESELTRAALATGLGIAEIRATIRSGIGYGMTRPRYIPEREHRGPEAPPDPPPEYYQQQEEEARARADSEHPEPEAEPQPETDAKPNPQHLEATPFLASMLDNIPPREWVYGHFLILRYLSVLGAPGGTGKTAYAMTVGVCIALEEALLGETVHQGGPVWIFNLEDPADEVLRRVAAICQHHKIDPKRLEGRLYLDSGRDKPLVVAKRLKDGTLISLPIVKELVAELKRRQIRLLIVDPFVNSHELDENNNVEINYAARLWSKVAQEAECCILLVHHFRKGGANGGASVDSFRGAVALTDAARAALCLSAMSEDDAGKLGVPANDKWRYVRADNAKLNLAPPPDKAVWLRLFGNTLPNGDDVQSIGRWDPPSPWEGMGWDKIERILQRLEDVPYPGELWSIARQSKDRWAGNPIVEIGGKTPEQAAAILKTWKDEGLIEESTYASPRQKGAKAGCIIFVPEKLADMKKRAAGYAWGNHD